MTHRVKSHFYFFKNKGAQVTLLDTLKKNQNTELQC